MRSVNIRIADLNEVIRNLRESEAYSGIWNKEIIAIKNAIDILEVFRNA